jgi:hypothetical protein
VENFENGFQTSCRTLAQLAAFFMVKESSQILARGAHRSAFSGWVFGHSKPGPLGVKAKGAGRALGKIAWRQNRCLAHADLSLRADLLEDALTRVAVA